MEIKGIANFAIMLRLINSLRDLNNEKHFIVDFSRTKLVDSTVLDFIHEHREKYFTRTDFEFTGLDVHKTSSPHPLALHVLERPMQRRLTGRQNDLLHFAQENEYRFNADLDWDVSHFEKFQFFEFHLMEYHRTRLSGTFSNDRIWTISDLTYTDGVLAARDEHHLTIMVITFPHNITRFSITKENTRQLKALVRHAKEKDQLPVKMNDFTSFLAENASYHLEGARNMVLIIRKERLLSVKEVIALHDFARDFCHVMPLGDEAMRDTLE